MHITIFPIELRTSPSQLVNYLQLIAVNVMFLVLLPGKHSLPVVLHCTVPLEQGMKQPSGKVWTIQQT